jgi:hypothetical protein
MPLLPTLINAINLAGSLVSILSYPLILIPLLALLAFYWRGRDMKRWQAITIFGFLLVGLIMYVIDISDRLGWLNKLAPTQVVSGPVVPALEPIVGQTFQNTTVILDGKYYDDCTFKNVTFRWNGGPYAIRAHYWLSSYRGFRSESSEYD